MWFQGLVSLVLLTIKCDCSTSVYFSMNEYTDYVNGATQLNCTVNGLLSADTIIFSRKKKGNDTEQILSTLEFGKQPKLSISGIHINIVELSANDSIFILTIDSVSCGDRGTYHCKVGDRQASAELIIWRKLGIPTFTMSRIIVENRFMLAEHPLICEGEVGEPGGNIFVETYTNGTYTQYQYYEVLRDIRVSEDTCSTYVTLKFALPGSVSLAMNNTAMRCVANNNSTLTRNESPPTSQPKRLYVVPANFCNGLSNGNYGHPYECTMFIECSYEWVIVDTCGTRCANVTGIGKISCQNCNSVDCMHQEDFRETTTASTGITQAVCSLDPETPTMTLPSDIYENQRTRVFCTAQLGHPPGSLRIEINSLGEQALRFESPVIVSKENCSNIGRIDLELYLNTSFNGSKILCIVKRPNNESPSLFYEKTILIKSSPPTSTTVRPMESQFQSHAMHETIIVSLAVISCVLFVVLVVAVIWHLRTRPRDNLQPPEPDYVLPNDTDPHNSSAGSGYVMVSRP